MITSSGASGGCALFATLGSSTSPGVISGAVTMKITSSTSITSTYGTTLIWFMNCLRRRIGRAFRRSARRLPLQDVRELLHEALEPHCQAFDVVRVAVVGDHRRDRGEEA